MFHFIFVPPFSRWAMAQEYEEHATESKRPLGGTYTTVKLRSGNKVCGEGMNIMNNSEIQAFGLVSGCFVDAKHIC